MALKQKSQRVLFLLAGAAVLLILLAMSLGKLTLLEGYAIPVDEVGTVPGAAGSNISSGDVWIIIIRGLIALAVVMLPVYIINAMMTPQGRRRLVADLVIIGILVLVASILENQEQPEEIIPPEEMQQAMSDPMDFTTESFSGEPMPELPDEAPQWLTGVVIAVIAVVVVALVLGVVWYLNKRKVKPPTALDQLADEAQRAIDDIQSGGNLQTAILRSYAEMTRLVREELGLARDRAMTARDFEQFLENKGLPGSPLHTLTLLFEHARYGSTNALPGAGEESQALRCLTDIVAGIRAIKVEE